jgi:hypothetical protein
MSAKVRKASGFTMAFATVLVSATLTGLTGGFATPAAAYEKAKTAQGDGSRRVCRTVTPAGSRLTRRICRTQAEWDDSQYRTQDGVLQQQMSTTTLLEQAPGPLGSSPPRSQ